MISVTMCDENEIHPTKLLQILKLLRRLGIIGNKWINENDLSARCYNLEGGLTELL